MSRAKAAAVETDKAKAGPTTPQIVIIRGFDFLTAIRWPVAVGFSVWTAIPYLAGRTTKAVFLVLFRQIGTVDAVPWILMSCAVIWAILERSLRRRKTVYLAARNRMLELQIDPDRSSSGLTGTGDSRK